jgi:MFS family permease
MAEITSTEWAVEKLPGRWVQLLLGLIAMMAISSPQYVWTLFRKPLQGALSTDLATIQVTFSVLVVLQTLFSPVQGYLTEKFGPRLLVSVGALLTGAGWVLSSQVDSVPLLYLTYGGRAPASSMSAWSG